MSVTIYHNSRCSKSRATLAILEEKNLATTVVNYLDTPPSAEELMQLAKMMGKTAKGMMRTKEDVYSELDLDNGNHTEEQLFAIMSQNPKLIERPIVVVDGKKAIIARPPELVYEII